jgi:hypothetical protein
MFHPGGELKSSPVAFGPMRYAESYTLPVSSMKGAKNPLLATFSILFNSSLAGSKGLDKADTPIVREYHLTCHRGSLWGVSTSGIIRIRLAVRQKQ